MKLKYAVPALVGILGIVVAGVAYASIPDSNGVFHACTDPVGVVRIIDNSTDSCKTGENSVTWNQSFTPTVTQVTNSVNATSSDNYTVVATCSSGYVVTGGGYDLTVPGGYTDLTDPQFNAPSGTNAWKVTTHLSGSPYQLTVYAVCLKDS